MRSLALAIAAACPAALAGVPDYGLQWSVVGDPGNRAVTQDEAPDLWRNGQPLFGDVGGVDYTYRITTTEVTNRQYLDFLNAYRPHIQGSPGSLLITGTWIYLDQQANQYRIASGYEDIGVAVPWRMAARYANWLHNGQGSEASDFETGAYDTSTFGRDPDTNVLTDQLERSPGSNFWIPNLSEWTKAMYWDPDKGPDGGYWLYHNGSDEPGIYASPGDGGTSNAGTNIQRPVASYDARSPWGLFDGSGGQREWTETTDPRQLARILAGSNGATFNPSDVDHIGVVSSGLPEASFVGIRIAASVPAPGASLTLTAGLVLARRRR